MDAVNLQWRRQFATCRQVRMAVLFAIAALSLSLALFLWWFVGAWMILPFVGLEIVCVAIAFVWLEIAANDRDCIEVTENRVKIVRFRGLSSQRLEFSRGWLSAELRHDRMGSLRGVTLRQSGRSVGLLEFLPVSEQHRALRELRAALSTR
jgi:uncharacterized membrane protein